MKWLRSSVTLASHLFLPRSHFLLRNRHHKVQQIRSTLADQQGQMNAEKRAKARKWELVGWQQLLLCCVAVKIALKWTRSILVDSAFLPWFHTYTHHQSVRRVAFHGTVICRKPCWHQVEGNIGRREAWKKHCVDKIVQEDHKRRTTTKKPNRT